MGSPLLLESDDEGEGFRRQERTFLGGGLEDLYPLCQGHLAGLLIAMAEQRFGGLVIKQEIAGWVHQKNGHSQIARELTHQDHLNGLLRHLSSNASGFARICTKNYRGGCSHNRRYLLSQALSVILL